MIPSLDTLRKVCKLPRHRDVHGEGTTGGHRRAEPERPRAYAPREAIHSSAAIVALLHEAAQEVGLPVDAVQLVETTDRSAVGHFLKMPDSIDLAIPRGGESLIRRVRTLRHAGKCN